MIHVNAAHVKQPTGGSNTIGGGAVAAPKVNYHQEQHSLIQNNYIP